MKKSKYKDAASIGVIGIPDEGTITMLEKSGESQYLSREMQIRLKRWQKDFQFYVI